MLKTKAAFMSVHGNFKLLLLFFLILNHFTSNFFFQCQYTVKRMMRINTELTIRRYPLGIVSTVLPNSSRQPDGKTAKPWFTEVTNVLCSFENLNVKKNRDPPSKMKCISKKKVYFFSQKNRFYRPNNRSLTDWKHIENTRKNTVIKFACIHFTEQFSS